jgi:hypothetical protein
MSCNGAPSPASKRDDSDIQAHQGANALNFKQPQTERHQSEKGKNDSPEEPMPFIFFPKWRMHRGFPWPIWIVGWLAVFKALLWLFTDPVVQSPLAELMTAKFLVMTIPFLFTGIGVWNLRKWAVWGLLATCALDLLFYVIFPDAARVAAGSGFIGLAILLLAGVGPLGDVLILSATPSLLKHAGKSGHLRSFVTSKG